MRGWKVSYEPEEGILTVGPTRGKAIEVQVEGYGAARGGRRYLLYRAPEELGEKQQQALVEFLEDHCRGEWDLMEAEMLSVDWNSLSPHEQDRMARREGFQLTRKLPE